MYKGFLDMHLLFVGLYLLLFLAKLSLLLAGRYAQLQQFRKKTRVWESILPLLFIGPGVMLAINSPYASQRWFIVKMLLLVVVIILGILAFKKNNKALGILTLLFFALIIFISFNKSLSLQGRTAQLAEKAAREDDFKPGSPAYDARAHGAYLFHRLGCVECHGENGSKGLSGAADLQKSRAADSLIFITIHNGRKNMPAYGDFVNKEETEALAAYVKSLRK